MTMVDLSSIVPRWEFRTFGPGLGPAAERLESVLSAPQSSTEIYILSPRSDVAVKIRHNQLDVKLRREIDPRGLEQWHPLVQSRFPISATLVGAVFACWKTAPPAGGVTRSSYDCETFLGEVVAATPGLTVIRLSKSRRNGVFHDCLVELTEVTIGRAALRTIAVEKEDPGRVLGAVEALGLAGHRNVNYLEALRAWQHEHLSPPAPAVPGPRPA